MGAGLGSAVLPSPRQRVLLINGRGESGFPFSDVDVMLIEWSPVGPCLIIVCLEALEGYWARLRYFWLGFWEA